MGAMPWSIIGPYDPDPKVALAKVQRKYFDHNYDLPAVIEQQIRSMESAVANCREDDEYGLLGTFTASLRAIKRIARRPIPDDQDAQIRMLRKLVNAGGEPLNNILDIEGVSKEIYPWRVFPLPEATVQEYFGTPKPSQMIAEQRLYQAYESIDRAEAVCFPVYRQRRPQRPVGIMYVGYTAD